MLVKKIMTQRVVTVGLDDNLKSVRDIFLRVKFHHILVVDKNVLCGVLSDRDLLKAISPNIDTPREKTSDTATLNKKVHQIMNREAISLLPDTDIYHAISVFNQHCISCIPIVDENRHVLGILSWRDIFRAIEDNRKRKKRS